MRKPVVIVLGVIVVAVGAYVVWWLASPLFIDQTVDEAFPTTIEELSAMSAEEVAALPEEVKAELQVQMEATAAAMPAKEVADAMPEEAGSEPMVLLQGNFVDADDFHQGSGTAAIYALPDGSRVLRFEAFEVTNGPQLHVYLAANPNPTGLSDLGEHVDLGPLKGNIGNQNYTIPESVDLDQYGSVIIYCVPFHVLFSSAPLQ